MYEKYFVPLPQKEDMIYLNIREEDRDAIAKGRYTQLHPRVMQKYDSLHMKASGLSNREICKIPGICNNTLLSFIKQYNEGGLERLNEIKFHRPQSDMKQYSGSIKKYFNEHPLHFISEAAAKIEELTGMKRGETQVRKFLVNRGFKFRKVGTVPAKALTEEKTNSESFWIRN
jgi:transposase